MQSIPCRLDYFSVVEVPDAQKNGDVETYGHTIDLKRYTNSLLIRFDWRSYLDACHCDLEFAHHPTLGLSAPTGIDLIRHTVVARYLLPRFQIRSTAFFSAELDAGLFEGAILP